MVREGPLPEGFVYLPALVPDGEADRLVAWFGTFELRPFEYRGYRGNRRVASFGTRYDFDGEGVQPAPEIPSALLPLRARVADRFGVAVDDLGHALVTEYRIGAPIGWHRDRPVFGDVFGVSFVSACRFRFRRRIDGAWERASVVLAPGSAYALRGPARTVWQHSIPPVDALRYSVTFRTIKPGP